MEAAYLWDKQIPARSLGEENHAILLCSTLIRNVQSMVNLPCKLFRAILVVFIKGVSLKSVRIFWVQKALYLLSKCNVLSCLCLGAPLRNFSKYCYSFTNSNYLVFIFCRPICWVFFLCETRRATWFLKSASRRYRPQREDHWVHSLGGTTSMSHWSRHWT